MSLLLAVALLVAQAPAPVTPTPVPAPTLPRIALETSQGRIVVEVEDKKAPITSANFLRYADQKRLDGISVYRVTRVGPRFGFIQFGLNGDPKKLLPPIKHEPTTQTGIKHLEGVISMPRWAPGTAQADFTISIGDQKGLDADPTKPGDNLGYAAFGRVVEGMDVVMKIFGAPIDPNATLRGSFKGEVPVAPVRILTVRRVKN